MAPTQSPQSSPDSPTKDECRSPMKKYWSEFSMNLSIEAMMLDNNANLVDLADQNEVIAYLPSLENLSVLELGCGIGRLTARLLDDLKVKKLHSTDFMAAYCDENIKNNQPTIAGRFTCACEDVTKQKFAGLGYDMVFSNWLFMYLSDAEVKAVFKSIYEALPVGGFFFLRESCFKQSGNKERSFNPTKYRSDLEYVDMLNVCSGGGFKIVKEGCSEIYLKVKGNGNQRMWLVEKTR